MKITFNVVEKSKGYLVVEFNNKYYRICNFTYENNNEWDLMELVPDNYIYNQNYIKTGNGDLKMNNDIYLKGCYDAEHLDSCKTKKEALKSLFKIICFNLYK